MFIGEGRAAFLEFLRNLTPQILFLTLALALSTKINFLVCQPNWQGIKNLMPFLMCVAVFCSSLIANTTKFIEASIHSNRALDKGIRLLSKERSSLVKTIATLIYITWRMNKRVFIELFLCLAFSYAGLYAALSMAVQGAITAVKALQF